jgi:glutamate---cysteine ligase / carboxylate-amine ligase
LSASNPYEPPTADALKAAFDHAPPFTVGLEDELMLMDPETFQLVPRAQAVIAAFDGDPRYKLELPASQIEIVTAPHPTVAEAAAELAAARSDLARATDGLLRPGAAGVHPLSSGIGELNALEVYAHNIAEYGPIATRQLVCAFQVHVAVPGADRALAVYNAARSYLPLLAALAANGAFYEGRDSELASVRPKLGELLPRQGVPPVISSWDEHAAALAWGVRSRSLDGPRTWWWELRPHPRFGTLEFRVPDSQASVGDGAGIAAVVQALAAWLAERHDRGERLPVAPTWRIEENRWSACRHGVEGEIADLETGERLPTRKRLEELLATIGPVAARLGAERELERARALVEVNGAIAQRLAAADGGALAVARWLSDRFPEPLSG